MTVDFQLLTKSFCRNFNLASHLKVTE
jgi:hypothetical protein